MTIYTSSDGNSTVWRGWVETSASTTASFTSNGTVWGNWNTTTTASASTEVVWVEWNNGNVRQTRQASFSYTPPALTEAQLAEQRAQAESRRIAEEESKKRADELLVSHLNTEQRKQFKKLDAFMIKLQTKRYEIGRGRRVKEFDEKGKEIAQYCIHPSAGVPSGDVMLAQKMMLEADEAMFLRIANRTPVN